MSLEELTATLPDGDSNARDSKVAKVIAIPSRMELGEEVIELLPQHTRKLLLFIENELPSGSVVAVLIPEDKYAEFTLKTDDLELPGLVIVDHNLSGELFAGVSKFVQWSARESAKPLAEVNIHGRFHVIKDIEDHLILEYRGSFSAFDEVQHRVRAILGNSAEYSTNGAEPASPMLVPERLMGKTANAALSILVAKAELAEIREEMGLGDASGNEKEGHPLVAVDFTLFVALSELGQSLTGLPPNRSVSGTFSYLSSLFARLADPSSDDEDDERFQIDEES
ncbi:MAG: hypothetical protein OXG77_06300 [Chloroflexi bacterium]|nr:hypothetical protein [Chloroflexota bacterium]